MAIHRTCDGVRRREFLRVGVLGGSALSLANHLRWASAGEAGSGPAKASTRCAAELAASPTS
jgi:hypothetical protein